MNRLRTRIAIAGIAGLASFAALAPALAQSGFGDANQPVRPRVPLGPGLQQWKTPNNTMAPGGLVPQGGMAEVAPHIQAAPAMVANYGLLGQMVANPPSGQAIAILSFALIDLSVQLFDPEQAIWAQITVPAGLPDTIECAACGDTFHFAFFNGRAQVRVAAPPGAILTIRPDTQSGIWILERVETFIPFGDNVSAGTASTPPP